MTADALHILNGMTEPPFPSAPTQKLDTAALPVVAERYDVLEEVGTGGMGRVYRVSDRETSEILALKLLRPEFAADPSMAERFKNELRLARRITHKNVCRIYDFNRTETFAYITMEYVDGETLRALLKRDGALPSARVIALAQQMCAGLSEAHAQGIVHRDLKPENIMVARSGVVKLMDFGIARSLDSATTQTMIGTPGYMSPEQAQGRGVDARTDIYALSLILYECLTGRMAFTGNTPVAVALKQLQERPAPPRSLRADIPYSVETVVLRCLEKEPSARFASVDALVTALTQQQPAARPAATVPTLVVTPVDPPRRWPWLALAAGLVVIGALWMKQPAVPPAPVVPIVHDPAPVVRERVAPPEPTVSRPIEPVTHESPAPVTVIPPTEQPRVVPRSPEDADEPSERMEDRVAGLERLRASAEAGDARAQYRLARRLFTGDAGVRDEGQAREWMRRAADQGYADAQFAVGMMHERGVNGIRDVNTAISWYERAAQSGHDGAQRALTRLSQRPPSGPGGRAPRR